MPIIRSPMILPIIGAGARGYWTVPRQTAIVVLADQLDTHDLRLVWDRHHRRLVIAPVPAEETDVEPDFNHGRVQCAGRLFQPH